MTVFLKNQETFKGKLNLNTIIPNLDDILLKHSIKVSEENSFDPENSCFESETKYTVIIKKGS